MSIFLGVLILVILTFGAYKCGFFKRPLKEARSIVDNDINLINSHDNLEEL